MVSKDMVFHASEEVVAITLAAAQAAARAGEIPEAELPGIAVEIPADTSHGDFSTNVAMTGAKALRMPPRKIAEALTAHMNFEGTFFTRAEVAGPGFINFFLKPEWFVQALVTVGEMGEAYGRTDYGGGKKVMVEFVSANPTGPMHMGNARGGAIGDCLASALEAAGFDVTREFYVNDAGNQIEKFGLSLEARYLQIYRGEDAVPFPEDGYHGDDIAVRAKQFADIHGDEFVEADTGTRKAELVKYALPRNIDALREDLLTYRIRYDMWFHESTLYKDGTVDAAVGILKEKGLTYEKDGALWYKATAFGGEKDEVLIRQNGNATYFAADIAYHYNKFALRGFDTVIDVWGADHHGHVARLKGAIDAVGLSGDKLDIVLNQMVRLMKDGEPYRMSKRTGKSVTLADLIEMVPIDAARFFFNMREPGSTIDFDLDLAVEESSRNPVYYVQYVPARINSILRKLNEEDGVIPRTVSADELLLLSSPQEISLIRRLAEYPGEIISAATRYDPARLTHYVIDIANLFHKFYEACRIRGQEEHLLHARLNLCLCTKTAVANCLGLLKITVPERM